LLKPPLTTNKVPSTSKPSLELEANTGTRLGLP